AWRPAEDSGCFLPRMRFTSLTQVLESKSVRARSLLLGFSMPYSTRSQSSNVRWICCWRPVRSIRRRISVNSENRHLLVEAVKSAPTRAGEEYLYAAVAGRRKRATLGISVQPSMYWQVRIQMQSEPKRQRTAALQNLRRQPALPPTLASWS